MGGRLNTVDAYIDESADYARPILKRIRDLFHQACPDIDETIKWGVPYFEYKGMVGGMAAFKEHVSIGFWKASLLADSANLFKDSGSSMSAVKIGGLDDMPPDNVLLGYIRESVELNERGIKLPKPDQTKPSERVVEVPHDLEHALKANNAASATFEGFSYSNRKDYVEWLTSAKQPATRDKRLVQAVNWMAEGKPRNWKYMKKYR